MQFTDNSYRMVHRKKLPYQNTKIVKMSDEISFWIEISNEHLVPSPIRTKLDLFF